MLTLEFFMTENLLDIDTTISASCFNSLIDSFAQHVEALDASNLEIIFNLTFTTLSWNIGGLWHCWKNCTNPCLSTNTIREKN